MNKVSLIVLSTAILCGCAWQSEALKLSEEVYEVSASASPGRGGVTGARELALSNANKHCDSMTKAIEVVDIKTERTFPASGWAIVTFKCG